MMNVAKKYNVKLVPLTDIHIGSGKDVEAYEYIVKDRYMYRIDISEMIGNMKDFEYENFYKILKKNNILNIRSWMYRNYKEEWGYIYKEKVSNEFEDYYKEKVDGADGKNENSELNISEFIGFGDKKYIPGSSIKGALRTAFIFSDFLINEKRYEIKSKYEIKNGIKVYNKREINKEAQIMESEVLNAKRFDKNQSITGLDPKKDPFKTVKIFDTEKIDLEHFNVSSPQIEEGNLFCEVLKGVKNFENINFENGIKFDIVLTEYLLKNNSKMDFKNGLRMRQLIDSLDDKMEEILKFEIEKEENSCNIKKFYENLQSNFEKIKQNNSDVSLIRVGKYTGFNDKTINLVTTEPSPNSRTVLDENNCPMGWALIKVEEVKY